jgi:hypothetical protein
MTERGKRFMERVESMEGIDVPSVLASSTPAHLSEGDQKFIQSLADLIAGGFCEKYKLPETAVPELANMVEKAISTCVEVKLAAAQRYETKESLDARREALGKHDFEKGAPKEQAD